MIANGSLKHHDLLLLEASPHPLLHPEGSHQCAEMVCCLRQEVWCPQLCREQQEEQGREEEREEERCMYKLRCVIDSIPKVSEESCKDCLMRETR